MLEFIHQITLFFIIVHINKYNYNEISFTPSKADEGDMRRANLYKAYIAKQIPIVNVIQLF